MIGCLIFYVEEFRIYLLICGIVLVNGRLLCVLMFNLRSVRLVNLLIIMGCVRDCFLLMCVICIWVEGLISMGVVIR